MRRSGRLGLNAIGQAGAHARPRSAGLDLDIATDLRHPELHGEQANATLRGIQAAIMRGPRNADAPILDLKPVLGGPGER